MNSEAGFTELCARFEADPKVRKGIRGPFTLVLAGVLAGSPARAFAFDPARKRVVVSDFEAGSRGILEAEGNECALTADDATWDAVLSGSLNPQKAFLEGALRCSGSSEVALSLTTLLARQWN